MVKAHEATWPKSFKRFFRFGHGNFLKAISIILEGGGQELWGLSETEGDSHKLSAVNPKFLATAGSGGIFLEISLFENPHDRLNLVESLVP